MNETSIEIPTNQLLSQREYENENAFTIEIDKKASNYQNIFYGETNLNDYVAFQKYFTFNITILY